MIHIPLVEIGTQEEAGGSEFASITTVPEQKNCAEDERVREYINECILPVLQWCRQDRFILEEEWREIRRMRMLIHDKGRRYFGRSNAYLPIWAKSHDTLVSNLSRGLFPSDEYMDVSQRGESDPEQARDVKAYLQWEFDTNAKLRGAIKPFLAQVVDYGFGALKHWYRKNLKTLGRMQIDRDTLRGQTAVPGFAQVSDEGLTVSSRNAFNVYVFPVTVVVKEQLQLIFEDIDLSVQDMKEFIRKGRWIKGFDPMNAGSPPEHDVELSERARQRGHNDPRVAVGGDLGTTRTVSEVWTWMKLPADQYFDFEDPEQMLPVRIVIAGDVPVEVRRNTNFNQQAPYEFGRIGLEPGDWYGRGLARNVKAPQYLSNDFANQTNDTGIYGLNPVVLYNPGLMAGPLKPISPGAAWPTTDVDRGIKFDRPPIDQVGVGLQMMSLYMGMAQDMSGAPPALQGASTGKGAKTATGAQILQKNASVPLQDIIEDLECDVMMPLMKAAWWYGQQYREEDVIATIAGKPLKISPERLIGDFDFEWRASSQSANQQQRAQAATMFVQLVTPLIPLLQQQGWNPDLTVPLRRIFSDGLGYRGWDDFMKKMPMAPPGMQPGMEPPGLGAGGPPPDAQGQFAGDPRSSNQSEGAQDMQSGEGEDFGEMRDGADAMAGMFGGAQ